MTTLSMMFYSVTIIKIKSLTTLTIMFYFTNIKKKSLTALTSLFSFTAIKTKSVTTLTTLFYLITTLKMKSRTALVTPF